MGKNMQKSFGLVLSSGLLLAWLIGNPAFADDSAPPEKTLQELLQERLEDMLARLESFKGPELEQLRIARQRVITSLERLLGRTTELPALTQEQRSEATADQKSQPLTVLSGTRRSSTSAQPRSRSDHDSAMHTASANTNSRATSVEADASVAKDAIAGALAEMVSAARHRADARRAQAPSGGSNNVRGHRTTPSVEKGDKDGQSSQNDEDNTSATGATVEASSTSSTGTSSSDEWQAAFLSHFADFFALVANAANFPKSEGTIVPHLPGNVAGHGGTVHTHEMPVPITIVIIVIVETAETLAQDIAEALQDPAIPEEIRDALREVLDVLVGQNGGAAENGLLDKLQNGDLQAALLKMTALLKLLELARELGAPTQLIEEQLAKLVQDFLKERLNLVTEAVGPLTPEVVKITSLVEKGDVALASGNFVEAVEEYAKAEQKIIEVDRTPPFLIFVKPQLGQGLQDSQFVIQVEYVDAFSAINPESVQVFLNDVDQTANAQITQGGLTLDLFALGISLPEARHTLRVIVSDTAPTPNSQDFTIFFFVDQTPPVITSLLPAPGSIVDVRRVEITGSFQDALSGTSRFRVRLFLDGVDVTGQAFRADTSVFFSTTSLAEGEHFVRLEIRDRAGNPAAAETRFRAILDTTPPRITLTPSSGTILRGFETISLLIEEPDSGLNPGKVAVFADSANFVGFFGPVPTLAPDGRTISIAGSLLLDPERLAALLETSGTFEIDFHILAEDRFQNRSELLANYPVSLDPAVLAELQAAGIRAIALRLSQQTPAFEEGVAGRCALSSIIAQAFDLFSGQVLPSLPLDFRAAGEFFKLPGIDSVTDENGIAGLGYIYPSALVTDTVVVSVIGTNVRPIFVSRRTAVPTVKAIITQTAPRVENHVVTSITLLEGIRTPVEFRVRQGTGRVLPENTMTDDRGFAKALYSQPTTGPIAIEVRFPEFPLVRDFLTGRVAPSILLNFDLREDTAMQIVRGNYQIGLANQELTVPFSVRLLDRQLSTILVEEDPETGARQRVHISFLETGFGTFRDGARSSGPILIRGGDGTLQTVRGLLVPVDGSGVGRAHFTPNAAQQAAVNVLWQPVRVVGNRVFDFRLVAPAGTHRFLSVDFLIGDPQIRLVESDALRLVEQLRPGVFPDPLPFPFEDAITGEVLDPIPGPFATDPLNAFRVEILVPSSTFTGPTVDLQPLGFCREPVSAVFGNLAPVGRSLPTFLAQRAEGFDIFRTEPILSVAGPSEKPVQPIAQLPTGEQLVQLAAGTGIATSVAGFPRVEASDIEVRPRILTTAFGGIPAPGRAIDFGRSRMQMSRFQVFPVPTPGVRADVQQFYPRGQRNIQVRPLAPDSFEVVIAPEPLEGAMGHVRFGTQEPVSRGLGISLVIVPPQELVQVLMGEVVGEIPRERDRRQVRQRDLLLPAVLLRYELVKNKAGQGLSPTALAVAHVVKNRVAQQGRIDRFGVPKEEAITYTSIIRPVQFAPVGGDVFLRSASITTLTKPNEPLSYYYCLEAAANVFSGLARDPSRRPESRDSGNLFFVSAPDVRRDRVIDAFRFNRKGDADDETRPDLDMIPGTNLAFDQLQAVVFENVPAFVFFRVIRPANPDLPMAVNLGRITGD